MLTDGDNVRQLTVLAQVIKPQLLVAQGGDGQVVVYSA